VSAIAGIIHFNNEPIDFEQCRNVMKVLEQFPSDHIHLWQKDHTFLGCHAQWITPESIGEELPFYDYQNQLAITADAIIDNREELFDILLIEKYKRTTMTDSQIILLTYIKYGEEAPKYLIGDFAFMIWDERKQRLFGARDFSGTRTLYYSIKQYRISFSTIIKPLFTLPYNEIRLNEQWLAEYLAISGMIDAVDSSSTPYVGIKQLPPSHSISITKENVSVNRYSTLTQGSSKLVLKSQEEYVEAFQEVFQKSVDSRLRTHLNIGVQLSGGLDSGAVASFAAKTLNKEKFRPLHTFSYIPPDDFQDFTPKRLIADERPYIQSTIQHIGINNEHYLDFKGKDSFSEIDDFLNTLEMPYKFFENSFWLKGMFEEAHKENVGVLLNGDRGNFTISWGSALDYYSILFKQLKWTKLLSELNQYSKNTGGARYRHLPDIIKLGFPLFEKFFPSNDFKRPTIINLEFAKKTGVYSKLKDYGIDESGWYSNLDIYDEREKHFSDVHQWNAGNTLASKLSLRYSLWKRDPTNDLRVVKFCLSLPESQYVQNGYARALIRNSTKNYLPDEVRLNQTTRGVQGVDWVHRMKGNWKVFIQEAEELVNDELIIHYLDKNVLNQALSKVKEDFSAECAIDADYKLLMRSLILHRFIKRFN
jgi:asparagine synthase (glutamine-hydrolysing)